MGSLSQPPIIEIGEIDKSLLELMGLSLSSLLSFN